MISVLFTFPNTKMIKNSFWFKVQFESVYMHMQIRIDQILGWAHTHSASLIWWQKQQQ